MYHAGLWCSSDAEVDIEAALTDPQSAQIPRRAVQIGVRILNAQKPASAVELLPSKLVTRDNVGEYKG